MRWWMIFKILLHPVRYAQQRIDHYVMSRVKRQPGPVEIGRRRVYIVPTRFGYGFAIMLLVMLLGAMNYSNSMAFALTFLLGGLGLVAMHQTHANLAHLQVRALRCQPVFAGETAHFPLQIDNRSASDRYSIAASWARDEATQDLADLPARRDAALILKRDAVQRGWLQAGVFSVWTEFPLGLFHAWTWAELEQAVVVYPKPAPPGMQPPGSQGSAGYNSAPRSGQDEFAGLRTYQRGDTARSIHWKSLPKSREPMVKQFTETMDQEVWLDYDALNGLPPEQRLSQLCRWVLEAEQSQHSYGLKLPGLRLAPDQGEHHQHACLKALALHQLPGQAAQDA